MISTKSHDVLKKKVKNLIQKVVNLHIFECKVGDAVLTEYNRFLTKEVIVEKQKFLEFNRTKQRLDDFYFHTYSEPVSIVVTSFKVSFHI